MGVAGDRFEHSAGEAGDGAAEGAGEECFGGGLLFGGGGRGGGVGIVAVKPSDERTDPHESEKWPKRKKVSKAKALMINCLGSLYLSL